MRGKGISASACIISSGITPAYAGKSPHHLGELQNFEDHPRLCGEKYISTCVIVPSAGSPPPMRGKVHIVEKNGKAVRITPAYAGKSFRL